MDELLEKLAALEHEQWAHWTKYMLAQLLYHENSANPIVRRWYLQIDTPYHRLSKFEKESDRVWAKKVLEIMEKNHD